MSNSRVITVVATKGGRIEKITTDVQTWGDLKVLIQDKYDLSSLKATENVGKTTLEHIDAALPAGDFRLFLRPSKTKSGGFDVEGKGFKDLRALVTTDDIKNHLNTIVPGKNWTQLSTDDLRKGLASYGGETKTESAPEVEEVTKNEVTAVAETGEQVKLNPLGKAKLAKQLIEEICEEVEVEDEDGEICERAEMATDELDTLIELLGDVYSEDGEESTPLPKQEKVETEEEKAARLEKEDIEREMRELEDGF